MKSTVAVVAAALSSVLVLGGCSGDDGLDGLDSEAVAQATAGARSTSQIVLKDPTVIVKDGVGYLVGTLENEGSEDVQIESVVVSGYQIVRFGARKKGQVVPVAGGVTVKGHGSVELGPRDTVVQMEVPTTDRAKGSQLTVDISFSDNTATSTTAVLAAAIGP